MYLARFSSQLILKQTENAGANEKKLQNNLIIKLMEKIMFEQHQLPKQTTIGDNEFALGKIELIHSFKTLF